jgi:hypothetical protein
VPHQVGDHVRTSPASTRPASPDTTSPLNAASLIVSRPVCCCQTLAAQTSAVGHPFHLCAPEATRGNPSTARLARPRPVTPAPYRHDHSACQTRAHSAGLTSGRASAARFIHEGTFGEDGSLMDPHEVAIAALNQVAQSPHRRQPSAGNVASSRSDPNATGVDMKSNAREENAAGAQEQSQHMGGSGGTTSNAGGSQESQSSTARALQSTSSSNNSQSTADGHDGVSTPPTSTSDGFSSQGTTQDGQISQLSQLSQLAAAQQPMATPPAARPNIAVASTAGHKRTADGQVKPPSPASPREFRVRGHSRTTSAVSNISSGTSSRIGEVSGGLPIS